MNYIFDFVLENPLGFTFSIVVLLVIAINWFRLATRRYSSNRDWWWFAIPSVLSAIVIYWYAPWAFLGYYLRTGFAIGYALLFAFNVYRQYSRPATIKRRFKIFKRGSRLVLGLFNLGIIIWLALGYSYVKSDVVDIGYPFSPHKRYYVMQGGGSRMSNPAHRNYSRYMYGYAMDVAGLNKSGMRATSWSTAKLENYAIWGDTIFAPSDGQVIYAVNNRKTMPIGKQDIELVHGNHILIQCDGYRVFMCHFIKGSIAPKPGDKIKKGDFIGLVGNSGFSSEPHLHLNIIKRYAPHKLTAKDIEQGTGYLNTLPGWYTAYPYDGESVPFTIEGKFYSINDIIDK